MNNRSEEKIIAAGVKETTHGSDMRSVSQIDGKP
jgi:hypothetical protein